MKYQIVSTKAVTGSQQRSMKAVDLVDSESIESTFSKSFGNTNQNIAKVLGSTDEVYTVSINAFCECRDAENGFYCKHVQAVMLAHNRASYPKT